MNLIKYVFVGFGLYILGYAALVIYQVIPPTLDTLIMVSNVAVLLAIFNMPIVTMIFLFKWFYNFYIKRDVVTPLHCEDNHTPCANRGTVAILCYESDHDYQ